MASAFAREMVMFSRLLLDGNSISRGRQSALDIANFRVFSDEVRAVLTANFDEVVSAFSAAGFGDDELRRSSNALELEEV